MATKQPVIECYHFKLKAFFKVGTFCNFVLISLHKLVIFLEANKLLRVEADI